jgi:hypothetical protein
MDVLTVARITGVSWEVIKAEAARLGCYFADVTVLEFAVAAEPVAVAPSAEKVPWTVAEHKQFRSGMTLMHKRIVPMTDLLADNPEKPYPTSDLVKHLGVTREQLRGSLSALTRHLKAHYGHSDWWLRWEYGHNLGPSYNHETYYFMDSDKAAVWNKARGQ